MWGFCLGYTCHFVLSQQSKTPAPTQIYLIHPDCDTCFQKEVSNTSTQHFPCHSPVLTKLTCTHLPRSITVYLMNHAQKPRLFPGAKHRWAPTNTLACSPRALHSGFFQVAATEELAQLAQHKPWPHLHWAAARRGVSSWQVDYSQQEDNSITQRKEQNMSPKGLRTMEQTYKHCLGTYLCIYEPSGIHKSTCRS